MFRIVKDISKLLGVQRETLTYAAYSSPAITRPNSTLSFVPKIVDLTEDNSDDSSIVKSVVSSSTSTRRRRQGASAVVRSPAGQTEKLICIDSSEFSIDIIKNDSFMGRTRRNISEGSTTSSSNTSDGDRPGHVQIRSESSSYRGPSRRASTQRARDRGAPPVASKDKEEVLVKGAVESASGGEAGLDGSDESSEWEVYDPRQWTTSEGSDHQVNDKKEELAGGTYSSRRYGAQASCSASCVSKDMDSTPATSQSIHSKGSAQSQTKTRTKTQAKGVAMKRSRPIDSAVTAEGSQQAGGPCRRKFGSVKGSRTPIASSSVLEVSPSTATAASSLMSFTTAISSSSNLTEHTSRGIPGKAHGGEGAMGPTTRMVTRGEFEAPQVTSQSSQSKWEAPIDDAADSDSMDKADVLLSYSSCESGRSVDGSVDGEDGVSSVTDSGDDTGRAKRARKEPKKFLNGFTELYETNQARKKAAEVQSGSRRALRPPLPPRTTNTAQGGKGGGSSRSSDWCPMRKNFPGGAPTAANHVVSRNKFVGVMGHGKRFRAVIDIK